MLTANSQKRTGTMFVGDGMCEYDTLIHRHIAPGATYTQFQFTDFPANYFLRSMRIHLITVDVTNPYNSFAPYLAEDRYYNVNKQSQEVSYEKRKGLKPVASMTGGAFIQSNITTDVFSANEMEGSLVANGVIHYEGPRYAPRRFFIDGLANIGDLLFNGQAVVNGNSFSVGQVNHYRDHVPNAISLFCNGLGESKCSNGTSYDGVDVKVRVSGDGKVRVGTNVCEVIEVMQGCQHSFGDNEAILSGVGSAATFLQTLKPGDNVTLDMNYYDSRNELVNVEQTTTRLFDFGITNGVINSTKIDFYAICAIGCSEDGKTLYMVDMENSDNSDAPVSCALQFMQQIGMYNAICLDGGPSAEMTIDGEFVTVNSVGSLVGRFIPGALMLYSTAPDDPQISYIECTNASRVSLMKGDRFKPQLYGFNQYGEMINDDAFTSPEVTVTCTPEIGFIRSDGAFEATNAGTGYIYVTEEKAGTVLSIPVDVDDAYQLCVLPSYIFTGEGRGCQVTAFMTKNGQMQDINLDEIQWYTYNGDVIQSCENGFIVPGEDGFAEVYAEYQGYKATLTVEVENLKDEKYALDLSDRIYDGEIDDIRLPSVPMSFAVDIQAKRSGVLTLRYLQGERVITVDSPEMGKGAVWHFQTQIDSDDVTSYPIKFVSTFGKGLPYCTKIKAYYQPKREGDIDDPDIVRVECVNTPSGVKYGEKFALSLKGYNQYGELVADDAQANDGIEISCTPEIGEILSDGYTFAANNGGSGYIYVTVLATGETLSIPINVIDSFNVNVWPKIAYTGEGREVQAYATVAKNGAAFETDGVVWTTNDYNVVTNCENGKIVPGTNGVAEVYATYEGVCDTIFVTVENIGEEKYCRDLTTTLTDGFVDGVHLPSLPYSFAMNIMARSAGTATLVYSMGDEVCTVTSDELEAGAVWHFQTTLKIDEITKYPVNIISLSGESTPYCSMLKVYYAPKHEGDIDDPDIVELKCTNIPSDFMNTGQSYVPQLLAYNQYGELVSSDAKAIDGVVISCSSEIGKIADDGFTFVATTPGEGTIDVYIPSTGAKLSIPLTVMDEYEIALYPKNVFTGEGKEVQVNVLLSGNGVQISPEIGSLIWSTNNDSVIVSCENGKIVPGVDGVAEVYAEFNGVCDTVTVTVENVGEEKYCLNLSETLVDGVADGLHIPSLPYSIAMDIKAQTAGTATLVYSTGDEMCTVTAPDMEAGAVWHFQAVFDADEVSKYPVNIVSLSGTANPCCEMLKVYYAPKHEEDIDDPDIVYVENASDSIVSLKWGETISLNLNGYNQYGELVSSELNDSIVEISCTEGLGAVEGLSFMANQTGSGYIYIKVLRSGQLVEIPVTVYDKFDITFERHYIFTGEGVTVQMRPTLMHNGESVNEYAYVEWTTDDENVVANCTDGLIVPGASGTAHVFAHYHGVYDSILVSVENVPEGTYSIDMTDEVYNGVLNNLHVPSLPLFVEMDLTAQNDGYTTLIYTLGADTCAITSDFLHAGDVWQCHIDVDRSTLNSYPVTIVSAIENANALCTRIKAYYSPRLTGDFDDDGVVTLYDVMRLVDAYLADELDPDRKFDMDGDGAITINDIVAIITAYLEM